MSRDRLKQKTKELLRKSEKYTKTDMVYLARGSFWQVVERGAMIAVGLASTWAFANLLPKTTYGEYKYILSLASLLTTFSLTGATTALQKAVARGFDGTYKKGFAASYKHSVALILLAAAGSGYYWFKGNIPLATGLLLIAVFQPVFNASGLYLNYLVAKKRFAQKTHRTAVYQIVLNLGLIGAMLISKNVIVLLVVFFVLSTGASFWFYYRAAKKIPDDAPSEDGFVRYARHLSLINILGNIATQIDSVLLFQLAGSSALAAYNIAIVIPEQIKSVNKNLAALAFAKFATNDEKQTLKALFNRKGPLLIGGLVIASIVYILAAPLLFSIFFPEYTEALFASQLFAVTIPFSSRIVFQAFFEARGRVREQYAINIFSGVARIATLVAFIPFFGLLGAIYARVVSRLATALFSLFLAVKVKREILG